MSLLNLPSDGLRSVLVAIHRTIECEGPTDRERLLSLCAPDEITDGGQLRQTLNTWLQLGLLQESNGKISLNPEIPKGDRTLARLPIVARRFLLASENNERFWEIEESRAADFTRCVSWCLAQDVYEFECTSWDDAQRRIAHQLPSYESLIAQNNTRWNGLLAWVPFLGFGHVNGKDRFVIDPTPSVRDALPDVFGKEKTLGANDFLNRLAGALPVVDGGKYRLKVEEKLRQTTGPHAWHPAPAEQLSTSLSRALLGLIASRHLKADTLSDADPRMTLTGRNGVALDNYSHVTWLRKN